MNELRRKCFKCGCSPRDTDIKLFRFPRPGSSNILKCESWAKFCLPDKEWFSTSFQWKLYKEHRMLCERHFASSSFVNYAEKKLDRLAVPIESNQPSLAPVATPGFSSHAAEMDTIPGPSQVLTNITNIPEVKQQPSLPTKIKPGSSRNTAEFIPVSSFSQKSRNIPEVVQQRLPGCKTEKENALYIKCRKQMKRICQLRNTIKKMKKKDLLCTLEKDEAVKKLIKNLTPSFSLMLQGQLRNVKRKLKGRRWSIEEKIIALRLYKRSPTCYRLLRRLWCLPAPSTLKSLLGNFELEVGINEKSLSALKKYLQSHPPSDNEFILMWDEMSIKKHLEYNKKKDLIEGYQDHSHHGRTEQEATHVLVFMLAGIRKKVKQPMAYYLSSSFVTADRLHVLIKEVITKCLESGICIAATVCDMDGVNRRAVSLLGATTNAPYFQIKDRQIVSIFDPPHLLKCFRNLFLKYDVKCATNLSSDGAQGQGIAKWSHIQEFYDKDNCNPNFVFAPSLRNDHMNPNTKQKMKVNLAAQVLSHSVACGIYAKVSAGELPSDALVTAEVVGNMDKLFDCLNADNADLKKGKAYLTNFTERSPHTNFFKKMKSFFNSIEFINCRNAPSQQGWIWTLNAVEKLFINLKNKHSIKSLATRRLQQDPLENLFGCIRGNCGSNTNPTTGQFVAGLKTAILANLSHIGKGNCEVDTFQSVLQNYKDILSTSSVSVEQPPETALTSSVISAVEDCNFSTDEISGEMQACAYVCGFLLKNIKTTCQNCSTILYSRQDDELVHIFSTFKEYNEIKKSLKYASSSLIGCVEHVATITNNYLKSSSHTNNLKENIAVACNQGVDFSFLEQCQLHSVQNKDYIIKSVFFIIIKRFCILKNRQYSDAASAIKLKKKINILKHV